MKKGIKPIANLEKQNGSLRAESMFIKDTRIWNFILGGGDGEYVIKIIIIINT